MDRNGPGPHTNNPTLLSFARSDSRKDFGQESFERGSAIFFSHPPSRWILPRAPPRPAQPGTLTHPGPGPDGSHGPAPDMDQRAREYGPGPGSGPHGPVRDPDQWACTLGPRAPHTTARTPTRTLIQLGPEAAGPKPTARPLHAQMGRERSRSSSRRRSVVCTLAHGNAPVHGPAPGSRSAPPMTSHLTGQAHPRHAGHKGGHHWR